MLRFEISESGNAALPPLDLADDDPILIGSGSDARVRLPARIAQPAHVRIADGVWVVIAEIVVEGTARKPGEGGALGDGITLELAGYTIRVTLASATTASPPQRTESLARELVRSLLGANAAPAFEIERGPGAGSRRELPVPPAKVVIGRGDEAEWLILDEDLSREHAEIQRGWDGVTIRDLDSKNGTRVDGEPLDRDGRELHDGARVELGNVVLVFRDPAERHMHGPPSDPPGTRLASPRNDEPSVRAVAIIEPPSPWPFVIAAAIAGIAIVGLAWILAS
ncbi:MAG: FHA domain-containing protein [Kofleriaceae bacterium]